MSACGHFCARLQWAQWARGATLRTTMSAWGHNCARNAWSRSFGGLKKPYLASGLMGLTVLKGRPEGARGGQKPNSWIDVLFVFLLFVLLLHLLWAPNMGWGHVCARIKGKIEITQTKPRKRLVFGKKVSLDSQSRQAPGTSNLIMRRRSDFGSRMKTSVQSVRQMDNWV